MRPETHEGRMFSEGHNYHNGEFSGKRKPKGNIYSFGFENVLSSTKMYFKNAGFNYSAKCELISLVHTSDNLGRGPISLAEFSLI